MGETNDVDGSVSPPRSPWTGSRYETRHRWQLDLISDLHEATHHLRRLAVELTAAHAAGWWLTEPMSSGHLSAARASRRQRARGVSRPVPDLRTSLPLPAWRLRLISESGVPGQEVLNVETASRTPVLAWTGRSLDQVSGPGIDPEVVADTIRQVTPTGLPQRLWALVPARVGANFDLVAHGSALRVHTVQYGVLVRTQESLTFEHAADDAATLLQAASAYERLADAVEAMAAVGGRLVGADNGLLDVVYDLSVA